MTAPGDIEGERRLPSRAGHLTVVDHGGTGPDVVLIHGANRTLLDWQPLRPHLDGLRVVAYDLRGHGRSELPADGDYSWEAHLADLNTVISGLGLHDPYIVGHSLGGMIACCYGNRRAAPGIVNLDGLGGGHPRLYPGISETEATRRRASQLTAYALALGPDILDHTAVETLLNTARIRAEAIGLDPDLETAAAHRSLQPESASSWLRKPPPSVQAALMAPLDGWSIFDEVRQTSSPTLLVHGQEPPPLAGLPDDLRALNEALLRGIDHELTGLPHDNDRVRVARVRDAGHMLHLQHPEIAAGIIHEFITPMPR